MSSRPATCMALHAGVIYGPIHSRRFGTSLGLNLLPPSRKVCSFNCVYCQYGWTEPLRAYDGLDWPTIDDVVRETSDALRRCSVAGVLLDRITLAGHGEPTLHPSFPEIVNAIRDVRDSVAPDLPIGILSNSATAHEPAIRDALCRLDERNMKLDVGRQDDLRRVNASSAPIDRIIDALAALPDVAIQSMFVRDARLRIDNTRPESIDAWLAALERVAPRVVQIYTIARAPALPDLEPVPVAALDEIAAKVKARGFPVLVAV